MRKIILSIIICSLIMLSCTSDDNNSTDTNQPQVGEITDSRDNMVYKTVKLGTQTWFSENLNFNSGDSKCYDDNPANCFVYGKLYNGNEAQSACPDGWHLPTTDEWQILFDYLGGIDTAHVFVAPGAMLQGNFVDFNLLAGGQKFINYVDLSVKGHYWTSTDGGYPDSYRNLTYTPDTSVSLSGGSSVSIMKNCRCVKDK